MMRYLPFVFAAMQLFFSCYGPPPQERILGAWQVDSSYMYYNGFDYTVKGDGADWAVLIFEENDIVKETKFGTYRQHEYEFFGRDSVVLTNKNSGKLIGAYKILRLNEEQMVLRRYKEPIFNNVQNQVRFEVRYFSRTEPPKNIVPLVQDQ